MNCGSPLWWGCSHVMDDPPSARPLRTFPTVDQGGNPTPENLLPRREGRHQTHIHLASWRHGGFSQVPEVGVVGGSGAQQSRTNAQGHSPQGEQREMGQRTWCTIRGQSEDGFPSGGPEGRPNGSVYGRSSAEAVAALSAAGLQDCSSSTGAHARTKTVLAGLTSIVGLKGALHGASNL